MKQSSKKLAVVLTAFLTLLMGFGIVGGFLFAKENPQQTAPTLSVQYQAGKQATSTAKVTTKTTTKVTTKTTKLKSKAKKTTKTTKKTTQKKTKTQTTSQKKVKTETTTVTTKETSVKKNSKVQSQKTTVKTTVKTTTTQTPQKINNVSIDTLAKKAHANVRSAFQRMHFTINVDGSASFSGRFDAKNQKITLKHNNTEAVYHELGHFVAFVAGNADRTAEFQKIYKAEKGKLKGTRGNESYVKSTAAEYFAEAYQDYVERPATLKNIALKRMPICKSR